MLTIKRTTQFKKDIRRLIKQKLDIDELWKVIDKLAAHEQLDEKYRDHQLRGQW